MLAAPSVHSDFQLYQVNPVFQEVCKRIAISDVDWAARSAERYGPGLIGSAARWLDGIKAKAVAPEPVAVAVDKLNDGQSFIYRVVAEHFESMSCGPTQPLRMMICGTAGSGKTWLIRAVKQLLGDKCLVLAPTGVAANNIGGFTYHSKIPIPRTNIDRESVRLSTSSPRYTQLIKTFDGVKYVIIDEMSMVGRRALGQIDEMLRQATGCESDFGGLSVILVGDHGRE